MAGRQERSSKVLPVTVVTIVGITNLLLLAFVQQHIANEMVSLVVGLYAFASVPLCAYGLVGTLKEKPKFIALFAKYLFLDAAIWAIGRFMAAEFFLMSLSDEEICGVYGPTWSPENFRQDVITSVQSFRNDHIGRSTIRNRCQVQVGVFQVVMVFLLLAFAAAHGWMAVAMRQHAKEVRKLQQSSDHTPESEKLEVLVVAEPDIV